MIKPEWMLRRALYGATTSIALACPAMADNGKVAHAYPIDAITVDGDLSDWPGDGARYPIDSIHGVQPTDGADFGAHFRVGYDVATQSLFVAVEVTDNSPFEDESDGADWDTQDTHALFVDGTHDPAGTSAVKCYAVGDVLSLHKAAAEWDPSKIDVKRGDFELAVKRGALGTVYEWRVNMPGSIAAGRTLGLDHAVTDIDHGDRSGQVTYGFWGDEEGKLGHAGRLGDLVLLERGNSLGTLTGSVAWLAEAALPHVVAITSKTNPSLWIQATVDSAGRYAVELPEGDYRIHSAFSISSPFGWEFADAPRRIDEAGEVLVHVDAGEVVDAPVLKLKLFDRPDYLFRPKGLLHNFEPDQALLVDGFVQAFKEYYSIPGVSVALVRDGEVAYHRTFGTRNILTGAAVTDTTLFEAASITKPVFAFGVMRLAERGIIDLDRPLHEYLPFPNIAGDPRSSRLTARFVLSHTSGLPNWAWGGPGGWVDGDPIRLDSSPGMSFGYSGEAVNYLGRVVEHLTDQALEDFLQSEVCAPMGMTRTHFSSNEALVRVASNGHLHRYVTFNGVPVMVSPASSMHTEALDFTKFMIGLMEGRGLEPETYEEMFFPHTEVPVDKRVYPEPWDQSVGLGFFLQETPWGLLVEHGGNNGDFHCKFGVFPESKMGYAIFTNSNVGHKLVRALELFLVHGRRP